MAFSNEKYAVLDSGKYRPYASVTEATTLITPSMRKINMVVNINWQEYWWRYDLTNSGLVYKGTRVSDSYNMDEVQLLISASSGGGSGSGTVTSVAGKQPDAGGNVSLGKGDVGLGSVNNTSDKDKPMSDAQTEAVNARVAQSSFDSYKQTNDLAVSSLTALNQPETLSMVSRLKQAGSFVESSLIAAIDKFFIQLKVGGALAPIKWLWSPMGTNLGGSLVNLITTTGVPSSMINVGFSDSEYKQSLGIGTGTVVNTSKYLDAGFSPSSLGLNNQGFAFGHFNPSSAVTNSSYFMALAPTPAAGTVTAFRARSNPSGFEVTGASAMSAAGSVMGIYNQVSPTRMQGYKYGTKVMDFTTTSTLTALSGNVNIFRGTNNASYLYSNGYSGGGFIASTLTEDQAKTINNALIDLNIALGRIQNVGGVVEIMGDSNTDGQSVVSPVNRWSTRFARNMALRERLIAMGGAQFMQASGAGQTAGYLSYLDSINLPANMFGAMWGTNDQRGVDVTTNGDPAVIATFKARYTTMLNNQSAVNRKTFVISPLWNSNTNDTKAQLWNQGVSDVARATGAVFVDGYHVLTDTGNPSSYVPSDGLHIVDAGAALLAQAATAAVKGFPFRQLSFSFQPVLRGASTSLPLWFGGANIGNEVTVSTTVPVPDGISYYGVVESNDNLKIYLFNGTGAAYEPTPQVLKVSVNMVTNLN